MSDIFNPSAGSTNYGPSGIRRFMTAGQVINFAFCGDSLCQLFNLGSSIEIIRQLTNGSVQTPSGNNLAVGGTYAATIAASVPSVIAKGADVVVIDGGRNDVAGGATAMQIMSALWPAYASLSQTGALLIWLPLLPETPFTQIIRQNAAYYNRQLKELCSGNRSDLVTTWGFNPLNLPIVMDASFMTDYTNGNRYGDFGSSDNTHLSYNGIYMFAQQIKSILNPWLLSRPTFQTYFEDWYDATNNPKGNLLNNGASNDGLLSGTGGFLQTENGVTPTGVLASGWFGERSVGSSTATMVASKSVPRYDQMTGTGQVIQVDWTGNGSGTETYRMEYRRQGFGIQNNIIIGNSIYIQATFELLEPATNWLGLSVSAGGTSDNFNANSLDQCGPIFLRSQPIVITPGTTVIFVDLDILTDGTQVGHVKGEWRDVRVVYQ